MERDDRLDGRIGQRSGSKMSQLGWKGVVPMQPGDLLDQVDLTLKVGTPPRNIHRDPAVLGLRHDGRADGDEMPLHLVPRQLDPEHLGHACGAKEDARRVGGSRPEIDRCVGQLTSGGRER